MLMVDANTGMDILHWYQIETLDAKIVEGKWWGLP